MFPVFEGCIPSNTPVSVKQRTVFVLKFKYLKPPHFIDVKKQWLEKTNSSPAMDSLCRLNEMPLELSVVMFRYALHCITLKPH